MVLHRFQSKHYSSFMHNSKYIRTGRWPTSWSMCWSTGRSTPMGRFSISVGSATFPDSGSCLGHHAGGRARWKIENETFNTLKNQGYHLEHNFGHGEKNLSVVLAVLMMLAFLVDQVQQQCCPLFQAAWHKLKTKCHLWEEIRNHFRTLRFDSMADLLTALIRGITPQKPVFENSS